MILTYYERNTQRLGVNPLLTFTIGSAEVKGDMPDFLTNLTS